MSSVDGYKTCDYEEHQKLGDELAETKLFLADEKVLRRHVEGRVKELEAFITSHDTQWFKCSECGAWNMRTTLLSILPPTQELL